MAGTTITQLDTPCREWQGGRSGKHGKHGDQGGYGVRRAIGPSGKLQKVYVHRWIMAQIYGWPALHGKLIMHLCDNPPCFRFDHLRIGTATDNANDAVHKGRNWQTAKTHCKHGHPLSGDNVQVNTSEARNTYRDCKTCQRDRMARFVARRNGND